MSNHPLLSITSQNLDKDSRDRFVDRGYALFRSLEAMPWPLFTYETADNPGMAKADRATLMEYGIHDANSLIDRMIRVYDDSLSYMLSGSIDPCACADFMRKAVALVPEISDLQFRTEKLLRIVRPEPDYAEEVKQLFDQFDNLDAVYQRIDDSSYTHYYVEAYDFFYARYAFGNGIEKSETVSYDQDMDNIILHTVNDYWRDKMRSTAYNFAKERCDQFYIDLDDLEDSIGLEIQILKLLAEDDRLDEYDRQIDWQHLQDYGDFTDEDIAMFQFDLNEAKVFQAQLAKELADAEEQRRADAERRSMPETAA